MGGPEGSPQTPRAALDLGVLISGRGSNLGAILDAVNVGRDSASAGRSTEARALDARVRVVISNKQGALGLARAEAAGVPTRVIPHADYASREAFDAALVEALRDAGAEWIVLAGFMRIVTPVLLDAFPYRVLNIHPSLLPAFPGVDAQAQAIAYGARVSGCTVHFVDRGTDTGPILAQAAVPVKETDTPASLSARILAEEHRLLVRALCAVAEGRVEVTPAVPRAIVRVRGEPI